MKKHFIQDRKVRYGGITVVLTVLIVAVTVLTNVVISTLAERYQWLSSMNTAGMFEVTDDCYAFLEKIFDEAAEDGSQPHAEIIFCDVPANLEQEPTQAQVYHTALSLQERFPENITVNCYDILSNPTTVRKYANVYDPTTGESSDIRLDTSGVIVVGEGYHRAYSLSEFYSFKDDTAANLWAYNGERKLAAGIMRAVTPNRPTACLTNNHGEVYFDYEILNLLDDAGYNVAYLDLFREPIPESCSLIVSYNPTTDLVEDELSAVSELATLEKFLETEGNGVWVFMGNASPKLPNYERFLADWGTDFAYHKSQTGEYRYMVQDTSQSLTSDGYTIYGEAESEGACAEILQDTRRYAVFKNATALQAASGYANNGDGTYTKGDRVMHALYTGGSNAVAWANGKAVDKADSAILMSFTVQTHETGYSYVGVTASVEYATEDYLQSAVYGNADVLFSVMEKMGRENTVLGLTAKPYEQLEISTITTRQMLLWTLTLTLIPALVVTAVAVVVLVKRRRA